jgi:hypothetical protein
VKPLLLAQPYDAPLPAPILVTGSHRSGTAWTGRMLALSPGVGYVHEPFNVARWPGWTRRPLPHWYQYVCEDNEAAYVDLVDDILRFRYPLMNLLAVRDLRHLAQVGGEWPPASFNRLRRARPLMKDPIALMSAEWLARRFHMQIVVMIRHPAAFAGSIKRLDWRFDFRNWADQPLLLQHLAGPYEREIRSFIERERDVIDQAVLMWNVTHHVIMGYRDRHPDWLYVRHEDLSEQPVDGFRELYQRLDLRWNQRVERAILRSSTATSRREVPTYLHRTVRRHSQAARWTWAHRLNPQEQERVREGTAKLASAFYGEEDWIPPEKAL